MTRLVVGFTVLIVLVGCCECKKPESGHLRVGTVLEKPWAYYNKDGVLEGYAIDITQRQESGFFFTHCV